MKNILIVISCLGVGGGERSLINLLTEWDYTKYSVNLLVLNDDGLLAKQVPAQVHIVEKDNRLRFLFNSIHLGDILKKHALITAIYRLLATIISRIAEKNINRSKQFRWKHFYKKFLPIFEGTFDTVFAYMNDDAMYFVADKVDSDNKVAWIHNDYYAMGYDAEMDRLYFNEFSKIITISAECLNILNEIFPEYKNKCLMIPNLSSKKMIRQRANEFYPEEYKNCKGVKLLSIGRLSEQKGYDFAIECAKILKESGVLFTWLVLGEGELRNSLEGKIDRDNLNDCFILCGIRENPYPYLKNCDIFIQPSRFEGKSVALDEAKILCKPIIVTNYNTARDQISEENGLIVEMNGKSIADGIKKLQFDLNLKNKIVSSLADKNLDNIDKISDYYELI